MQGIGVLPIKERVFTLFIQENNTISRRTKSTSLKREKDSECAYYELLQIGVFKK